MTQDEIIAGNRLIALERILNMSEDVGREGCSYGDTEFDSLSAAYGYNLALNQIKSIIQDYKITVL